MFRIALFGLASVALVAPASAEPDPEVRSATIAVKASDFASADQQARLQARVDAAVENICGNRPGTDFRWSSEITSCRRAVRGQIDTQIEALKNASVRLGSR